MAMPPLREFLDTATYDQVSGMRAENALPAWNGLHPHKMRLISGKGSYMEGEVPTADGGVKRVRVADCHGQILCNSAGYGNPEIEEARALARERGIGAFSPNFLGDIVEWARAVALESLGPDWQKDYVAQFVTSGTEANDTDRRLASAAGHGNAALINLREGYSGAGYAANAACGHRPWKGDSTPSLPNMHFTDPDLASLSKVLGDFSPKQYAALMAEAGNFGVGGFGEIPDEFFREAANLLRSRLGGGGVYPDEVQVGLGRTGRSLWASQTTFKGMQPPEAITAAKGIGAGHRAALVFMRRDVAKSADGLTYHTFAEDWEDMASLGTVLQMAQRDDWTGNARDRGAQLREGIERRIIPVTPFPVRVQGRGLMQGVVLDSGKRANAVLARAPLDEWIPGKGGIGGNILRVAPPLNVDAAFVDEVIQKMLLTLRHPDVEKAA